MGRKPGEVGKLAEREGISRQAAWFRLRRASGKPPGRPLGSKQKHVDVRTLNQIKRRYVDGETLKKLARLLGISSWRLSRLLKEQGVRIRRRNMPAQK